MRPVSYRVKILFATMLMVAVTCLTGCPNDKEKSPGQSKKSVNAVNTSPSERMSATSVTTQNTENPQRILAPARGCLYHGVHIGGDDGEENVLLKQASLIEPYVRKVGRRPVWAYFSHEWWDDGPAFPLDQVRSIANTGSIPFIRLMLRSSTDSADKKKEKYYTLNNIAGIKPYDKKIHQAIEDNLKAWGRDAREKYKQPLIVEWGTEANNRTFHWNGKHNGKNKKATDLFKKTFQYIVHTVNGSETVKSNITWVFHVTAESDPEDGWNKMAAYYPDEVGDGSKDVVDWLGVSIYGISNIDDKLKDEERRCEPFKEQLKKALEPEEGEGLLALARRNGTPKPIFILEFGTTFNYTVKPGERNCLQSNWIQEAFNEMVRRAGEGELAGFSWWNERFEGDGTSERRVEMRFEQLQETTGDTQILEAYRSGLTNPNVVHASAESPNTLPQCRIMMSEARVP